MAKTGIEIAARHAVVNIILHVKGLVLALVLVRNEEVALFLMRKAIGAEGFLVRDGIRRVK